MAENGKWDSLYGQGRPFLKMQGLHNHFVIVDARQKPYTPTKEEITHICDEKTGIGADELLIIQPPTEKGAQEGACAFMRIINVDGNDAQACGNATRCFGWLMLEETGQDKVILETVVGSLVCERKGDKLVSVEMGKVSTDWRKIPLSEEQDTLSLNIENGPLKNPVALNVGNPHAMFFVENLDDIDMVALAPKIQTDPLFPENVNVGVVEVVNDRHIKLAVYERPGILTTACGSGACAATKAAQLRGYTNQDTVKVEMPAGSVNIHIRPDDVAVMTGPVEFCFSGNLLN